MSQNSTSAVAIVVAIADNGVIGAQNALPWHLPEDLKHFRRITTGHAIVMGRLTWESIGKALPNRRNLVLTSDASWAAAGAERVVSLQQASKLAHENPGGPLMVIGGAQVYAEALPIADTLYLTQVHDDFSGDTLFPRLDMREWREIERETVAPTEERNFGYSFVTLVRR